MREVGLRYRVEVICLLSHEQWYVWPVDRESAQDCVDFANQQGHLVATLTEEEVA